MKQQMLKIVLSDLIFLAALYTLTECGRIEKSRAAHPISKPNDKSILVPTPDPGPVVFTGRGGTVLAVTAATMEALSPWEGMHEGVFGDRSATPVPAKDGSCRRTIEIEIQGLKSPATATTINNAFDPTRFYRPEWRRKGKDADYFMIVKFKAVPIAINPGKYATTEWASISFGNGQGATNLVPETADLIFYSPDRNNITIKRTETLTCNNPQDNTKNETVEKLTNNAYFWGIGIPAELSGEAEKHATKYFNKTILCEIYGSCEAVPEGRKIFSTHSLHSRQQGAPRLIYAAFANAAATMLAVENCALPPAIVTTTSP
jgi:hypothetical protein